MGRIKRLIRRSLLALLPKKTIDHWPSWGQSWFDRSEEPPKMKVAESISSGLSPRVGPSWSVGLGDIAPGEQVVVQVPIQSLMVPTNHRPLNDLQHWLHEAARQEVNVRARMVETLLSEAITLQDFDKLDRLHVVTQWDGSAPGVASYLKGDL